MAGQADRRTPPSTVTQARRPTGTPAGGQYSTTPRTEAPTTLAGDSGRVDPSVAHRIPATELRRLLPGADPVHLPAVRSELARHLTTNGARGRPFTSWQEAWDDLTGAAHPRGPALRLRNVSCPGCGGRGFTTRHPSRNLARTGHPNVCGQCAGRRRTDVTLVAHSAL